MKKTSDTIPFDTRNTEKLDFSKPKDVQTSSSTPKTNSNHDFSPTNNTPLITRHADCPFDIPEIFYEIIKYPSLQLFSTTKALRTLWNTINSPDWLRVILTFDDLSNTDSEKPDSEKLQFAQKNKVKIKIKNIQTAEDAQKVIDFIENPENTILSKLIDTLEFGDINDDNCTTIQTLLDLIVSKAIIITSFACGEITGYANLKIPFDQLISFSCGQVNIATLKFPKKLNELISFTCGNLYSSWPIKLPTELNKLKFIYLQDIELNLTFPKKLDNLITFSCVAIWADTTLTFSEKLDNLTSFSAEHISDRVTITLPKELPKLELISYEEINSPDVKTLFDDFEKTIKEKASS